MNHKPKLCAIFNYAPHYRFPIYKEMDNEFECDFYFGDKLDGPIKKINYNEINGFRKELSNYNGNNFQIRKGVWKLALKKKYKTFIITWEPLNISLWFFLILCKILGKKVFSWQHGISKKQISKKFELLEKFFLWLKEGTFLYGNFARQNMINNGFKPEKLHIIYNSLDYKKNLIYRESKKNEHLYEHYFNNSDPVLLFIGRLTPVKKLHLIIEVQKNLIEMNVFCNSVFIGEGEMKEQLKGLISEYNLKDRVLFTGAIYDESKIAEYLHFADLCISPGNVGLTAIHCLSYGLPVITNNNFENQMPEFEAIENDFTGGFFIENDEEDLLKKVKYWLEKNSNNREVIRNNCYKIVDEKYNPKVQIGILKNVMFN